MSELRTLLKRDESYAAHALLYIAERPGSAAAEISAYLHIPPAFLAKVLRKLVKAGYIESRMGRGGGVTLKVPLETLSLLEVIEAVSGPLIMDTCQTLESCATEHRQGHCSLKAAWLGTTLEVRHVFSQVRLAQLSRAPRSASDGPGPLGGQ